MSVVCVIVPDMKDAIVLTGDVKTSMILRYNFAHNAKERVFHAKTAHGTALCRLERLESHDAFELWGMKASPASIFEQNEAAAYLYHELTGKLGGFEGRGLYYGPHMFIFKGGVTRDASISNKLMLTKAEEWFQRYLDGRIGESEGEDEIEETKADNADEANRCGPLARFLSIYDGHNT